MQFKALLMPFNGINKNSVVIMDNCSIRHIHEVTSTIRETGAILHFAPYSPDYNPVEEAFSKVKIVMKCMEVEMQALDDIDTIIYAAFLQFLQMIAKPGLNNLVLTGPYTGGSTEPLFL